MASPTPPSDPSQALPNIETQSLSPSQDVASSNEAPLTRADIINTLNSMVADVKTYTEKHLQNVTLYATGDFDPEVAECLSYEYKLVNQMLENLKAFMRTTEEMISGYNMTGSEIWGVEMEDEGVQTEMWELGAVEDGVDGSGAAAVEGHVEEEEEAENEHEDDALLDLVSGCDHANCPTSSWYHDE